MSELQVVLTQLDQTTSQAQSREHSVTIDRPKDKGGQNKGPLGGETFLMGLGGCFMSNLLAAARKRDIEVNNVTTTIVAHMGDKPERVTDIHMVVTGDAIEPALLKKLVTIAERGCALVVTLKRSVEITVSC